MLIGLRKIFGRSFSAVFSSLFLVFFCSAAGGQIVEEKVTNTISPKIPLKIEIIGEGSSDFFNDLRIKVTNTGKKPIYSLRLSLDVDDTLSPLGYSTIPFRYGRRELRLGEAETPTDRDGFIGPGESHIFENYKQVARTYQRLFSEGKLGAAIYCRLRLVDFGYGDRTGFSVRGYVDKN